MVTLKSPQNGEKISLLTDIQMKFLKTDRTNSDAESIDYLNLKKVGENHTFPKPVLFEWEGFGDGTVFISENKNFENYFSISGKNTCIAENLKCNTRYFWKVICDNEESDTFYFDTEDMFPRFLRVDGILNVRDCGGWKTEGNQRIRQGMIFRGSEMNSHLDITPEGLKTMSNVLKIKTVLDLRGSSENPENVYGKNYVNIPCFPYSDWFLHPDVALKIFEILSDEKNYPIYFHCWGGADRTGTLAFIIGAVLGQNLEDLLDDYEITSLAIWGSRSRNTKEHCKSFLSDLDAYSGDTLQEKTENHLISCGIKKEQIENLRKIMLY